MVLGNQLLQELLHGITLPNKGEVLVDNINTKDKKMFIELRKHIRYGIPKSRKSDNI